MVRFLGTRLHRWTALRLRRAWVAILFVIALILGLCHVKLEGLRVEAPLQMSSLHSLKGFSPTSQVGKGATTSKSLCTELTGIELPPS